jgi:methylthioxylose transferase
VSGTTLVERRVEHPPSGRPRRLPSPETVAVVAWAFLILVVHVWGRWLQARGHRLYLNLPPLVGHLDPRMSLTGAAALVLAPAGVLWGPPILARLTWRRLLWTVLAAAAVWALALALTEGVGGVLRSPSSPRDYLSDVPLIASPLGFLRGYVDRIGLFSTHVRAHPPGMVLIAWALSRLGGGPAWLAGIEIAAAASAVPAALIALREVSDEARARAAAPFLALMPAAITMASSGDALFTGVGAWAVTLLILATGRRDRRGDALALAGGFAFGAAALLSYGLVLLGAIPVAVSISRRRVRPLALAVLTGLVVQLAFLAAGFAWFEGLAATRIEYLESVARFRPYPYFLVANVAAFAIVLGPAAVAGLSRLRDRGAWLLVGCALVAVAAADLSGMSKAEVERIWLPFVPWVMLATSALPSDRRRAWLAVNVSFALLLELAVSQPW